MLRAAQKINSFVNENKRYSVFSFFVVIASLIPLMFKGNYFWLTAIECVATGVFIFEYIARWLCCTVNLNHGKLAYIIYPFTPMAVIDLLTILPTFVLINKGFRALRAIRLILILRLFRFVKYSRSIRVISAVIKRERGTLGIVCIMAVAYIFVTALLVFNVEPGTFSTFFDAVYWACISLTTVGYGDIYPTSVFGQIVSMVSALVGVAIVALPTGIITGGYIESMKEETKLSK